MLSNKLKAAGDAATQAQAAFLLMSEALSEASVQAAEQEQIIEDLNLDKPQFRTLASYGHFGRNDIDVRWEDLDKVEALKKYLA